MKNIYLLILIPVISYICYFFSENLNFLNPITGSITLFRLLLLCGLTYSVNMLYVYHLNKKYPKRIIIQKISPESVFVFDLHGVIFKLSPIQVIKEFIKAPNKIELISTIFYPKLFLKALYAFYKGEVAEEVVLNLAKKHPELKNVSIVLLNALNAQEPIVQTLDIIKDLKSKNYKLFIFSNIGERSINILKNKFPDVFACFDGVSSTNSQDGYIKKPDIRAFNKHLNQFQHEKSNVIFIDDKMKNVLVAQSLGIPSILFTSPYELRKTLNKQKIF